MNQYNSLSITEIEHKLKELNKKYDEYKEKSLKLNMARGKPCSEQLDLSSSIFNLYNEKSGFYTDDGTDCRNYGIVDGIEEAKVLFADLLNVSVSEIIVGGNSSLNMMYDSIVRAMMLGTHGGKPWGISGGIKFLCPSPGYDRHFAICEILGIEMITIDMRNDGPDMDSIEALVEKDESIKGIWCVPMYSNPDGITYSDEVVDRLASMKTAANDFRIMWDNAYLVHHLYENDQDSLKNILEACKVAGNPDRVYIFTSTSKITFPGSGIAAMAASESNIKLLKKQISMQTIGHDKTNQLRHVRFLKNSDNINKHMKKHANIIRPKFKMAEEILENNLGKKGVATWSKPKGGYFISFNTIEGCAAAAVSMAQKAGVTLTPAGATYPYGKDPRDMNIRIAPTFPSLEELRQAMEIFTLSVEIVTLNKILEAKK